MTPGPQAWAAAAAALGIMAPFVLHRNSPEKKGFQGLLLPLAQCWPLGPHCEGLPWRSASIRPLHCLSPPRRAEARREVNAVCQTFCRGLAVWPEPRTLFHSLEESKVSESCITDLEGICANTSCLPFPILTRLSLPSSTFSRLRMVPQTVESEEAGRKF